MDQVLTQDSFSDILTDPIVLKSGLNTLCINGILEPGQ